MLGARPRTNATTSSSRALPYDERAGLQVLRCDAVDVLYRRHRRPLKAVCEASLSVMRGQTMAVIGESGSGKTSLVQAICGFVPVASGEISVGDERITDVPMRHRAMRAGSAGVSIVFQNPLSSLDPRWPVWRSVSEALPPATKRAARHVRERSFEALDQVGLSEALALRRPHELSGGQRQRATIARAIARQPRLVILDEVVSALDVSVRNEILGLLGRLRQELHLTYVFVSHDMASVAQLATDIAVMYRGWIVEQGPAEAVIRRARHPYTRLLLDSVPRVGRRISESHQREQPYANDTRGCVFAARCGRFTEDCAKAMPELASGPKGTRIRCLHPIEQTDRGP